MRYVDDPTLPVGRVYTSAWVRRARRRERLARWVAVSTVAAGGVLVCVSVVGGNMGWAVAGTVLAAVALGWALPR